MSIRASFITLMMQLTKEKLWDKRSRTFTATVKNTNETVESKSSKRHITRTDSEFSSENEETWQASAIKKD